MSEADEIAESLYQSMTTWERERFRDAPNYERDDVVRKAMGRDETHAVVNAVAEALGFLIFDRMGDPAEQYIPVNDDEHEEAF